MKIGVITPVNAPIPFVTEIHRIVLVFHIIESATSGIPAMSEPA